MSPHKATVILALREVLRGYHVARDAARKLGDMEAARDIDELADDTFALLTDICKQTPVAADAVLS